MSFETAGRPSRRNPEFEPQPADGSADRVSDRTNRALGRAATAATVENPSTTRSARVQRALGKAAAEGSTQARARARDRT